MNMKKGAIARVIQPVIQGEVKDRRINGADEIELLLEFPDGDQTTQRWFDADQLEEVKPE